MKSKITIEIDFENNNQPIIQILQYPDSDDVRDKLLTHFCNQFSGGSWCQIKWVAGGHDHNRIHISPIKTEQLKEQSEVMLEQHRVWNEHYNRQNR